MLIIAGTITIDPDQRDEALAFADHVMRETRKEVGCHEYVFSADPVDPSKIKLFELWDGEDELAAHFETEHLKAFQAGMGAFAITGRDLIKYQIASSGPLN